MKQAIGVILSALVLASCGNSESTTGDAPETAEAPMHPGKQIFINNCIQCHTVGMDKIGPKLAGSLARWDNDTARYRAFIRNSQELIKAGDPRAVQVYEEWNKTMMTPMPHLTDKDIDQVIEYIHSGNE